MYKKMAYEVMRGVMPRYKTRSGKAYAGDAMELIKSIPDGSISLIVTSPPHALKNGKRYGNADSKAYVRWFMFFADEFYRVLREDGNLVLSVGGDMVIGTSAESPRDLKLFTGFYENEKFHFKDEFAWASPTPSSAPADWIRIKRVGMKDAVNYVWWLTKNSRFNYGSRNALSPYIRNVMRTINRRQYMELRSLEHNADGPVLRDYRYSVLIKFLTLGDREQDSRYAEACRKHNMKAHPTRYPLRLPEFFIKYLTEKGDVVLDPFAGSNATGEAAEGIGRLWIAFEINTEYIDGSMFRFDVKRTQTALWKDHFYRQHSKDHRVKELMGKDI